MCGLSRIREHWCIRYVRSVYSKMYNYISCHAFLFAVFCVFFEDTIYIQTKPFPVHFTGPMHPLVQHTDKANIDGRLRNVK